MKGVLTALLLVTPLAHAVVYSDEPDPVYEKAGIALFCMNHFYNRTTGHVGLKAGLNAQTALADQLPTLQDSKKLAEMMRLTLHSIDAPQLDAAVPMYCWQFVPQDHDLDDEQLKHFLSNSSE